MAATKLFYCRVCGGVYWTNFARTCSGTAQNPHKKSQMKRADTVPCKNTPGLIIG